MDYEPDMPMVRIHSVHRTKESAEKEIEALSKENVCYDYQKENGVLMLAGEEEEYDLEEYQVRD